MKNYSELSDFEINCLVAGSLGNISVSRPKNELSGSSVSYLVQASSRLNKVGEIVVCEMEVKKDFCNNPSEAWPIILSNLIALKPVKLYVGGHRWFASKGDGDFGLKFADDNPLRAAMIVYLMMKESENEN